MNNGALSLQAEQATAAINKINQGFSKLQNIMTYQFNLGFINVLSLAWGSPLAQETVGKFCESMNSFATSIYNQSENVVNSINSNAAAWMQAEKASWTNVAFTGELVTISNEKMSDKLPDGSVGIIPDSAQTALNQLPTLESNLHEACALINEGATTSGFSGQMGQTLADTLSGINSKIGESFTEITAVIKDAIQQEIQKAQEQATSTSSSFSGN